jgi:hypothetical protein
MVQRYNRFLHYATNTNANTFKQFCKSITYDLDC